MSGKGEWRLGNEEPSRRSVYRIAHCFGTETRIELNIEDTVWDQR